MTTRIIEGDNFASTNESLWNSSSFGMVQDYGSTESVASTSSSSLNESSVTERKDDTEGGEVSFLSLLQTNRPFRLYMLSYIITHMGEWLTYIASMSLTGQLLENIGSTSRTAISILVVVRLLPNVLLCPIGGILADGWDRRVSMIVLDLLGAATSLLFLGALYFQSIEIIYLVTFLQQCVAGLYEPCRSSIVPLLVPEEHHLKKAITLAGLAWSLFAAVGSSLGGLLLTWFGFKTCFVVDALSYVASAYMMYLVKGKWHVAKNEEEVHSFWGVISHMSISGVNYLKRSFFGGLVLLKATIGLMYGAADVLNVSFSEPNGIQDADSAARLGMLFASMGVGCTIGPLIADRFTDMKQPISLQKACITGLAVSALGFFGIALFDGPYSFWYTCAFTLVRTGGGSTNWIDSSILLQKFTSDNMMGRVLAVDYSLALLAEALSAFLAGYLQDRLKMTAHQVSFAISCLGSLLVLCWVVYHRSGRGAGAATSDANLSEKDDYSSSTDVTQEVLLPEGKMAVLV